MSIEFSYPYEPYAQILMKLLHTKEHSDCTFLVGNEQKKVPAHKLILASVSKKFEEILYGENHTDIIDLPETDVDSVNDFLMFIYCGITSFRNNLRLWYLSCKFHLPDLNEVCFELIKKSRDHERNCWKVFNVCVLLTHDKERLDTRNVNRMKSFCLKVLTMKSWIVIQVDQLKNLKPENLENIFSHKHLGVNELQLFRALDDYATHVGWSCDDLFFPGDDKLDTMKKETKVIKHIRSAFKKIRYLNMPLNQFNDGPAKSGRLTAQEVDAIRAHMTDNMAPMNYPEGFTCDTNERYELLKISEDETVPSENKMRERFWFTTRVRFETTPRVSVTETFALMGMNWKILVVGTPFIRGISQGHFYIGLFCEGSESNEDEEWERYAQVDVFVKYLNDDDEERKVYHNIPWFCYQREYRYKYEKFAQLHVTVAELQVRVEASLSHVRPDGGIAVKYDTRCHFDDWKPFRRQ